MINGTADHFWADLFFLGVLAPPFFLGVVKFLSQTSHIQRPEETERMNQKHEKNYTQLKKWTSFANLKIWD